MNMDTALHNLGVGDDTLTQDEKAFLSENGYLPLGSVMTSAQVEAFRSRLKALWEMEGEKAGSEVHQEEGSIRLSDLINKDPLFDFCYTHPRLLAAIRHILTSDFRVYSLNARAALPGEGLQALHMDWGPRSPEETDRLRNGYFYVANSIWLLNDFTEDNGATRLVPGSHKWAQAPKDGMGDPRETHPEEVLVKGKAGEVVVFNGHTWHSGTLNRTDRFRRGMHMAFARRALPQQTDQKAHLRPATDARLTEEQRILLDV